MAYRTDKQAALDAHGAWILEKLEKRFGEERLGLNTQEIGQVLDSMMGPAYDANGTPTPQRQDPAEAARRLIAQGVIHDGHHGKIQVGKGGRLLSVPLPALAASLASMMIDPQREEADWIMGQNDPPAAKPAVITQTRGPRSLGFMIAGADTPVPDGERAFHWAPEPSHAHDPSPEEQDLLDGVLACLDKIGEQHLEERAKLRREALQQVISASSRPSTPHSDV
jgi:hypothetical protein